MRAENTAVKKACGDGGYCCFIVVHPNRQASQTLDAHFRCSNPPPLLPRAPLRSCCALLAFILPTLCYTRLEKNAGFPLGPGRKLLNNFILAAGVFAMISGTADTLHRIGLEYSGGDDGAGGNARA